MITFIYLSSEHSKGWKEVKGQCEDINECGDKSWGGICAKYANCKNTQGSYNCVCEPGFIGDGFNCERRPCNPGTYGKAPACFPLPAHSHCTGKNPAFCDDFS